MNIFVNFLLTGRMCHVGEYWSKASGEYFIFWHSNWNLLAFKKKKITSWKRSVRQNSNQGRTNQNARMYFKTALPYNNGKNSCINSW